jgi:hypothetical protein
MRFNELLKSLKKRLGIKAIEETQREIQKTQKTKNTHTVIITGTSITLPAGGTVDGVDISEHDHSLGKGASPIALSGVPDLPTSKITSGTFAIARIPDLPTTKITSGSFLSARIGTLPAAKITYGTYGADLKLALTGKMGWPDANIQRAQEGSLYIPYSITTGDYLHYFDSIRIAGLQAVFQTQYDVGLSDEYDVVICDTSAQGTAIEVTLPYLTQIKYGKKFYIKKSDSTTNPVLIRSQSAAAEYFESGTATLRLGSQFEAVTIAAGIGSWYIFSRYVPSD